MTRLSLVMNAFFAVNWEVFVYKGFLLYTVFVLICFAGDGRESVTAILIGCVAIWNNTETALSEVV